MCLRSDYKLNDMGAKTTWSRITMIIYELFLFSKLMRIDQGLPPRFVKR